MDDDDGDNIMMMAMRPIVMCDNHLRIVKTLIQIKIINERRERGGGEPF